MLKNLNITVIVLTSFLVGACADNRPSSVVNDPKVSPKAKEVRLNDKGEQVLDLDPIDKKEWTDPVLDRLEKEIKKSREARTEEKLAPLKEERLDFNAPTLTLKKDGREEITLNVLFKGEVHPITFLSPEDHGKDFLFEQTGGFKDRKVTLQGMCLDDSGDCLKLAVQVAYDVKNLKVTEQFIVSKVADEEEEPVTDGDNSIDSDGDDTDLDPIDVDTTDNTDGDVAPIDIDVTIDEDDFLTNNPQPIEPSKTTDENKDPIIVTVDEDDFLTNNPQPIEPSKTTDENKDPIVVTVDENDFVTLPTGTDIPVPTPRPKPVDTDDNDGFAKLPTGSNIPTPTPRPNVDIDSDPDLVTGSGQLIFPDLDDKDKNKDVFNVNTGEDSPKDPTSTKDADRVLKDIQTKRYNQSRGYYSKHKVKGHIKRASQLSRNNQGLVANTSRRDRQYGSGLLIDTLKYASKKFSAQYPKSLVCTNDLSRKTGGNFSPHGSHQNGLDADISYPSTGNTCSNNRNFFPHWTKLNKRDSKFFQKNWSFIKILLKTKRVHAIFTDRGLARSLCKYIKRGNRSSKAERQEIFSRLYHIKGHDDHYHVRMKCNKQNKGCVTQPRLNGKGKLRCN